MEAKIKMAWNSCINNIFSKKREIVMLNLRKVTGDAYWRPYLPTHSNCSVTDMHRDIDTLAPVIVNFVLDAPRLSKKEYERIIQ